MKPIPYTLGRARRSRRDRARDPGPPARPAGALRILGLVWLVALGVGGPAAAQQVGAPPAPVPPGAPGAVERPGVEAPRRADDDRADGRARMVREQIERRGIEDARVLEAMRRVPRHLFVPEPERELAYGDHPLPIGEGQTISQPYIVATMTELARLEPGDRVLEVGTGSGYQAAVAGELADSVFTVEIVESLAESAAGRLRELGYANVVVRHGDGYAGWPEHAPFDAILVTAAPESIPPALIDQLARGGRLVLPVGGTFELQHLVLVEKDDDGQITTRKVLPVRFVPMVPGQAREPD